MQIRFCDGGEGQGPHSKLSDKLNVSPCMLNTITTLHHIKSCHSWGFESSRLWKCVAG